MQSLSNSHDRTMEFLKLDKVILTCTATLSFPEIHRLHVRVTHAEGDKSDQVWLVQSEFQEALLYVPNDKDWANWLCKDAAAHPFHAR